MDYTKAYNLTTASNATEVLYRGHHCIIKDFFLFCKANATIDLYVTEYFTTKDSVGGGRRTKTYYIYKDFKLYAGQQSTKLLSEYDAANREWISSSPFSPLELHFSNDFRLYITCATTGGEVDVVCNLKGINQKEYIRSTKRNIMPRIIRKNKPKN